MPDNHDFNELDARPQSRREWSGWLRSLLLPLGFIAIILGGLLYWQSGGGGGQADSAYGTVELPASRNPSGLDVAARESRPAPDFVLQTLAGGELRLSDLQGKPVLVNFWATWCTSCRSEIPDLIDAYERYQSQGLMIIGVNLREGAARVRSFVDDFEITFPIAFDRSGEVAQTWRIGGPNEGVPSSYFIDRNGVVRKVVFGGMSARVIEDNLRLIISPAS